MRISVIIPAYNSAKTIEQALDSVQAQNYPDMEIIVVDDGSTDDTVGVVNSYSLSVNRGKVPKSNNYEPITNDIPIQLIRLPKNAGVAAARNAGIKEAKGEWIAFLDSDDVWMKGKIEVQMRHIALSGADMVCAEVLDFIQSSERMPVGEKGITVSVLKVDQFISANPVATSTVIIKKAVLGDAGLFDERFCGPEDYDLWIRVASKSNIHKLHAPMVYYRSGNGISMDDRRFLPQVLKVLDKAYGQGGALARYQDRYKISVSNQYWNAAWMAYNRVDRPTAIRYLIKAYWLNITSRHLIRRKWLETMLRYCGLSKV